MRHLTAAAVIALVGAPAFGHHSQSMFDTTKELVVTALHPGVTREQVVENTGWPLRFADPLGETPAPTADELSTLRDLQRRTAEAHSQGAA